MNTFKITNITNFLGKRDYKANSPLDIEYVDNMTKKTITVKPNESVYLSIPTLPLSVHRLRVKQLITVSEISEAELAALAPKPKTNVKKSSPEKPKAVKRSTAKAEPVAVEEKAESAKKSKTTKKETEE
jgi:hypothetical protein